MTLDMSETNESSRITIPDSAPEFSQWLESMFSLALLPGGLPNEFRRKVFKVIFIEVFK